MPLWAYIYSSVNENNIICFLTLSWGLNETVSERISYSIKCQTHGKSYDPIPAKDQSRKTCQKRWQTTKCTLGNSILQTAKLSLFQVTILVFHILRNRYLQWQCVEIYGALENGITAVSVRKETQILICKWIHCIAFC